jgi:surfeit locus 1 family protein
VYRFALRPRWVLSHVLVGVLVVVLVLLGLWQLRRLDERQERNALISARTAEPTAPLADVVDADGSFAAADGLRFRRVEVSGTYEPGSDVVVRNRTFGGQPGSWLLGVLRLDDGDAVVVNRGWVPVTGEQEPPTKALVPEGRVTVEGLVETTQERGRFGSTDPEAGTLRRIARVDVARLAVQIEGDVYPVWLQLEEERPDPGELPVPVEPPELSEGSHFSYAMQWFTFAAIAVIGYPLVLRRVARQPDEVVDDGPPPWDQGARSGADPGAARRTATETPVRHG